MDDSTRELLGAILVFVMAGVPFAMIGACIGHGLRNRMFAGALLGFFFGPIGWLFTFAFNDTRSKCHECMGAVKPGAIRCFHCGVLIGTKRR